MENREGYKTTSVQRRIFTLQQLDHNLTTYNDFQIQVCQGDLNIGRLTWSFKEMVRRHESLRTSFGIVNDEVVQYIHENASFEIEVKEVDKALAKDVVDRFVQPFNLGIAPLMRVKILKIQDNKFIILRDIHHIVTDRISEGIYWSELFRLYNGETLPKLKYHYRDYAAWKNEQMNGEQWKQVETYWLDSFSGEIPVLELHTDYTRPAIKTYAGSTYQLKINKEMTSHIKSLAWATDTTVYRMMLAAYNVLLSKYTGQEDIIVGSAVIRRNANTVGTMGMFVNTIPLRNFPTGEKTFREFLGEVTENSVRAFKYQDYPFDELIEKLKLTRSLNRNPLFDVMFVQDRYTKGIDVKGIDMQEYRIGNKRSKFDIDFSYIDTGKEIELTIEYSTELFKEETIKRLGEHYLKIIQEVCEDSDKRLSDIDMVLDNEKQQILKEFNDTAADFPTNRTLHVIVEEQAAKNPNKIALFYKDGDTTYGELNDRANSIAYLLREKGAKPDSIIGIMIDRSFEMIVGILGILKSGAAYLPINPEYPDERIRHMIMESESQILLTESEYLNKAKRFCEVVNLNDAELYEIYMPNLINVNTSNDLAYVIYTSGSTGMPKGVMVEHKHILNTIYDYITSYKVTNNSVMLFCKNYSFDMSVIEIFACLLCSGSVVILPRREETNIDLVISLILKKQVTHLDIITALINIWFGKKEKRMLLADSKLRYISVGGEEIVNKHVINLNDINEKIEVSNGYGPTETTVYSTATILTQEDTIGLVNIGKPTKNVKTYIISPSDKLQPIGIKGELCIGGISVSRGYLNNPELTAEKFVENPFSPGERMYKTGDLACWRSDGKIEFLGRMDGQVKIRSYRIELGDVESRLLECDEVHNAVVLAKSGGDGNKYLCAYTVFDTNQSIVGLKNQLMKKLPEYMIPSVIIKLESMPFKTNGKIDRQALLNLESIPDQGLQYEAPGNETEDCLLTLWEKILGVTGISVNDNFFDIGGHSLRAVILANEISAEFGSRVGIEDLFQYTSIREQARLLSISATNIDNSIQQVKEQEYYEATSVQRRIYTVEQLEKNQTVYNEFMTRVWDGRLDVDRMTWSFREMIQRHDVLRTSFDIVKGKVVQRLHEKVCFEIEVQNVDESLIQDVIDSFVYPFDLEKAPLMRVKILKLNDKKFIILRDMHHIVTDMISEVIYWSELFKLYHGENLPELQYRYRDFSAWQKEWMHSDHWKQGETYWLNSLSGELPTLELHTDYPRPTVKTFAGAIFRFKIESEVVNKLRNLSRDTGTTIFMILLAAYNVLLSKHTGQEDIIIGSPAANRRHVNLNNIIGMFANTIPLRNYPKREKTFRDFLCEVKTNTLRSLEYQQHSYDELLDKLNINRILNRNPLFDVVFQNSYLATQDMEMFYYNNGNKKSKFDITFNSFESEKEIDFLVEYSTELFKEETIWQLCDHYLEILKEICNNSQRRLSEINMLTEKENYQLLAEFNGTMYDYTNNKILQDLFNERVEQNPDCIALVYKDDTMSYGVLNAKSNSVAHLLREKGARPDSIIAIMIDKSFEMIIGILGILKSGAAYLPIDPEYPMERIQHMILESESKVILSQKKYLDKAGFFCETIDLENVNIYSRNEENLDHVNTPRDLAYVIYTSGSTGKPKGVMIEHRNVTALIETGRKLFGFTSNDIWTMFHSYNFDFSVWEMFGALLLGGKLVLISKETARNPVSFREILYREKVTVLNQTPQAFYMLSSKEMNCVGCNLYVEKIIFGGEALEFAKLREWNNKYHKTQMINMYGITETTVHVTYKYISREEIELGKNSIGVPLPAYSLFIVDKDMNLLPIGVAGEMVVGGSGLARGYLKCPELTSEKFVDNPFNPGECMYRSGDVARWHVNGNIEYLGRVDNQVKIRGFRIEINEVESRLLECDGVSEAAVLAKENKDGSKYLCGYITSDLTVGIAEIKKQMISKLPLYMIPTFFIKIEYMPLTQNGKVDKRALLNITDGISNESQYEAPSNETEKRLIKIWENILEAKKISLEDNFFDIGGQSLKAVMLTNEISREFNVEFGIGDVFNAPTIRMMSEALVLGKLNKEHYIIFNKDNDKSIFAFPPHSSFGIAYGKLSEMINNIRMVSFDFFLITELINYYVEVICQIEKKNSILLLAYSAGGGPALEVACELERRGRNVANIILLDSYVNHFDMSKLDMTYIASLNYGTKEISNVINYYNYYSKKKFTTPVNANIHLIKAVDRWKGRDNYYRSLTNMTSYTYEGSGKHLEMLDGENLLKNSEIIKKILEKGFI